MQRRSEVKTNRGMIFTISAYENNREGQVSEKGMWHICVFLEPECMVSSICKKKIC